jgi:hypothetical protein
MSLKACVNHGLFLFRSCDAGDTQLCASRPVEFDSGCFQGGASSENIVNKKNLFVGNCFPVIDSKYLFYIFPPL